MCTKECDSMLTPKELELRATILRRDVIEMTTTAGSGHPSSCLSAADIMATLWFHEMFFDPHNPHHLNNDQFIMSKGHAAPLYYAVLKHVGCANYDLNSLRKHGGALEGHPTPRVSPWIPAATGSLGQGLALGCGCALGCKMQKSTARTYVLLGDSECAEGSVWEAAQFAAYHELDNLCTIVDINRLGQRGETMLGHNIETYKKRFSSFGWNAIAVNGHKIVELESAFKKARTSKKPTVILAKTLKGKGVTFMENKEAWHGRALTKDECAKALKELPIAEMPSWKPKLPTAPKETHAHPFHTTAPTSYEPHDLVATREAYGKALARCAVENPSIVALDAEVSNSTYTEKVQERTPHQFVECFIAEQTLISVAHGLSLRRYKPFAATFAAFLTRAHDQLRMTAISNASVTITGSHAGVSIGEDGPSQMGLEDMALFRSLPHTTVFYPSDAIATERIVQLAAQTPGLTYIRTTRAKTPVIYKPKEEFIVNDFKAVHLSNSDSAVLVGAGITLHEALKAHNQLKKQGVSTAVVDVYCIKPFPDAKFIDFAKKHGNRVIVVEDHYYEGGIGEMIAHTLANTGITFKHLAVKNVPYAGTKDELLADAKIDARAIVSATHEMVK
ncbi:MAG: transketolase [Nanoarchaeota archaeon]